MPIKRNRPSLVVLAAETAGELVHPKTAFVETAAFQEHQKNALAYLEYLHGIACRELRELSPTELAEKECLGTATIHYGFPDHPLITSPNFILHEQSDYALVLTNRQISRDYHEYMLRRNAPPESEKPLAVYPNYIGLLIRWMKNIEGTIHETRYSVRPPLRSSHQTLPVGVLNIEGTA